ncbi:MAG: hypothetical protein R3F44_03280 [Candidatus Competibacteraceae bacterium]
MLDLANGDGVGHGPGVFTGADIRLPLLRSFQAGFADAGDSHRVFFVRLLAQDLVVVDHSLLAGIVFLASCEPRLSPGWTDQHGLQSAVRQLQIFAVLLAFLGGVGAALGQREVVYQEQQGEVGWQPHPLVGRWPNPPLPEDVTLKALGNEELPSGVYRLLLETKETLFLFTAACRRQTGPTADQ